MPSTLPCGFGNDGKKHWPNLVIDTRISKTVSQTAAERDADRAASQESLKNVQEGAAIQRGSEG
jgi:hypothetical protein